METKKIIIAAIAVVALGTATYMTRDKLMLSDAPVVSLRPTNSGSVSELIKQASSGEQLTNTGYEVTIDQASLQKLGYAGGGTYQSFLPQVAQQALDAGKKVILYFNASRDPTDQALDSNIDEDKSYIPAQMAIFKIDYDTNKSLATKLNVTQQNTLILLTPGGQEQKRIAVGVTTLKQIVKAFMTK